MADVFPIMSPQIAQCFLLVSRGHPKKVENRIGNENISKISSTSFSKLYRELFTGLAQIIMVELLMVINLDEIIRLWMNEFDVVLFPISIQKIKAVLFCFFTR